MRHLHLVFTDLQFSGSHALTFLQGMASADVTSLTDQQATLTTFCQHQGKILASGILHRLDAQTFRFLTSDAEASAALTHLAPVARLSRVKMSVSYCPVTALLFESAQKTDNTTTHPSANIIYALGPHLHIKIPDNYSQNSTARATPSAHQPPTNSDWIRWQIACMQAGIPVFTSQTLATFIPNHLGLVPSSWVSVQKGCYCGQEIIARTYHLGKSKKALWYLHSQASPETLPAGSQWRIDTTSHKLHVLCSIALNNGPTHVQAVGPSSLPPPQVPIKLLSLDEETLSVWAERQLPTDSD